MNQIFNSTEKLRKPVLFQGGYHEDDRGFVYYNNSLDLTMVKRTYMIHPHSTSNIRAWQGHKIEQKWFQAIAGKFKIIVIQPDNWDNPSENLGWQEYDLSYIDNQVLYVPGGYATGLKSTEPESRLLVFSDLTLEESSLDNFRFDTKNWYNWGSK